MYWHREEKLDINQSVKSYLITDNINIFFNVTDKISTIVKHMTLKRSVIEIQEIYFNRKNNIKNSFAKPNFYVK